MSMKYNRNSRSVIYFKKKEWTESQINMIKHCNDILQNHCFKPKNLEKFIEREITSYMDLINEIVELPTIRNKILEEEFSFISLRI